MNGETLRRKRLVRVSTRDGGGESVRSVRAESEEAFAADGGPIPADDADAAAHPSSAGNSDEPQHLDGLLPNLTREELEGDLMAFPMLRALRDLDARNGRWIDPEALV